MAVQEGDSMSESRELTREEVQDLFLRQIAAYIDFWLDEARAPTMRDKMQGLVFSILVILDGGSPLPGFLVAPSPHESDRAYAIENGKNWFPPDAQEVSCDIAGNLHEIWCRYYKAPA
jgi:hypothetical protein